MNPYTEEVLDEMLDIFCYLGAKEEPLSRTQHRVMCECYRALRANGWIGVPDI